MKKIIFALVFVFILLVVGIWSPWLNWNLSLARLLGLGTKESSSGLKVFSLLGEIEVYLNNEYKGSITPEDGEFSIADIKPGIHSVKLVRKASPEDSYYQLSRDIRFDNGVDVIISYELGPTKEFSEGHIFYAEKSYTTSNNAVLNVISSPDGSQLMIDDIFRGDTPLSGLEIDLSKQHDIKLVHEGYDTINFKILPESQEERDKLKGYTLNLEINMFLIPLDIKELNGEVQN